MTPKLLIEIVVLFTGLFVAGTLACLPLYHWRLKRFLASRLWIKIYWWWAIFAVFVLVLYVGWPAALLVVCLLLIQAGREWRHHHTELLPLPTGYTLLFAVALLGLVRLALLPPALFVPGLIAICFASVLSDVGAFFAGSYAGRHPLPDWINPGKSWEGVAGQLVGAIVGLALVAALPEIGFSWPLALGVGLASAAGDLLNSVAKRQLGIKDWSQAIPGHGGVLDRFSSLSFALAVGYIILVI